MSTELWNLQYIAGETVMMMHEMIVMVVVAGQEDRNGFLFALLNFCL